MSSSQRSVQAKVAALALILFVGPSSISQAEGRHATPAYARDLPNIHIDNFGRVSSHYFRGAEPDDEEYPSLAAAGIKTVIDLRSDDVDIEDRVLVERAGMKYERIPRRRTAPTVAVIERDFCESWTIRNQPVYVHCGEAAPDRSLTRGWLPHDARRLGPRIRRSRR